MAVIAVIMSVNFMACSDDDDEDDKQSNTIIGTWEVTGDTSDEEYNDIGDIYTFYSDGTGLLEWVDNSGKDSSTCNKYYYYLNYRGLLPYVHSFLSGSFRLF